MIFKGNKNFSYLVRKKVCLGSVISKFLNHFHTEDQKNE